MRIGRGVRLGEGEIDLGLAKPIPAPATLSYRLVVLTHGDGPTLERCLDSFLEYVTPSPTSWVVMRDGPGYSYHPQMPPSVQWWTVRQIASDQIGFCRATEAAWSAGADADESFIFYLEHDFEFTIPVDLRDLAAVLDKEPQLAQMALMRDAVSDQEKAAGGLYELRRDHYEPRSSVIPDTTDPGDWWEAPWLQHRSYLTTNPSLMRRDFMAAERWPDYPNQCEGRFGIDLLERGYTFGVWGDGRPSVRHIGDRTGFGY